MSIPKNIYLSVGLILLLAVAVGFAFSRQSGPYALPHAATSTTSNPPHISSQAHTNLRECLDQANNLDAPQSVVEGFVSACRKQYP